MSAGRKNIGVPFLPPSLLLLSGPFAPEPPIVITNLPSLVNFRIIPSAPLFDAHAEPFGFALALFPPIYTKPLWSTKMPCSVAGQMQPSDILHLSGSAGPPHARNSLPLESNSITDGAGRQQSPSAPYGREKPIASTGFPSFDLLVAVVNAASSLVNVRGR